MITQIISDIHNRFPIAEAMIDEAKPDNVVFLGDYFDSLWDTLIDTKLTAEWLKESLEKKNRIHIIGNHDQNYLRKEPKDIGYTPNKKAIIEMTGLNLNHLVHYAWVGDWLCTHAGLSYDFYKAFATSGMNVNDLLETYTFDDELTFRLYSCSNYRGGTDAHSGIIWCDYEEFVDIPDYKQIFGHTRGELRQTENHICLDTGNKHYALYNHDTDEMSVKEFDYDFV